MDNPYRLTSLESTDPSLNQSNYGSKEIKSADYNKLYRREIERGRNPRTVVDTIDSELCLHLLDRVRGSVDALASNVTRTEGSQSLIYRVIDGVRIKRDLPEIYQLAEQYLPYAEELYGAEMKLLEGLPGVNANVIPIGGQQGVHVDRNPLNIVVYLNNPAGGELEVVSGQKPTLVKPYQGGRVAIVGGDVLYHQVHPVRLPEEGQDGDRVCLVFGYGLREKDYSNKNLDTYLYGEDRVNDPEVEYNLH